MLVRLARTIVRSFILGLKDLVHFAIAAGASEYHLKGVIAHGNDATIMLAAIIATSSFVWQMMRWPHV